MRKHALIGAFILYISVLALCVVPVFGEGIEGAGEGGSPIPNKDYGLHPLSGDERLPTRADTPKGGGDSIADDLRPPVDTRSNDKDLLIRVKFSGPMVSIYDDTGPGEPEWVPMELPQCGEDWSEPIEPPNRDPRYSTDTREDGNHSVADDLRPQRETRSHGGGGDPAPVLHPLGGEGEFDPAYWGELTDDDGWPTIRLRRSDLDDFLRDFRQCDPPHAP